VRRQYEALALLRVLNRAAVDAPREPSLIVAPFD
jgi:hypothetical protein